MNIDLAQLDKLEAFLRAAFKAHSLADSGSALACARDWVSEVRRSLTSDHRETTIAAPADLVVVPRVPTKEMLDAGYASLYAAGCDFQCEDIHPCYAAILAAAPVHDAAVPSAEQADLRLAICNIPLPDGSNQYRHGFVSCKEEVLKLLAGAAATTDHAPMEYRTCCDHPDCTTCAGRGGFYRLSASAAGAGSEQVAMELDRADCSPVPVSNQELAAFHRFCDCCEDSDAGGHDVPKAMMSQLVRIGLIRPAGPGRHETTKFGDWVRDVAGERPSAPSVTVQDERAQSIDGLCNSPAPSGRRCIKAYGHRGPCDVGAARAAHPAHDGEKD